MTSTRGPLRENRLIAVSRGSYMIDPHTQSLQEELEQFRREKEQSPRDRGA